MPPELVAARPLPQPHQPPSVSRAKAHQILSERQFRPARPNLFEQFLRWISQHLGSGVNRLAGGGWGAVLGWGALSVIVALVAFIGVVAARSLRRDPERPEPPIRIEPRRSATDWMARAEAAEAGGDWKEGLRGRYRALVAELIEARVVLDLPGRTTGEYRGDVGVTLASAAAAFSGATELFERAWYGNRSTGSDERDRFVDLADDVVRQARSRRASVGELDDRDDLADRLVGAGGRS